MNESVTFDKKSKRSLNKSKSSEVMSSSDGRSEISPRTGSGDEARAETVFMTTEQLLNTDMDPYGTEECCGVHLKAAANSAVAPLLGEMKFSFLQTRQPIQPSVGSELFFHTFYLK